VRRVRLAGEIAGPPTQNSHFPERRYSVVQTEVTENNLTFGVITGPIRVATFHSAPALREF